MSVHTAFDVLEFVANALNDVGVSELAEQMGLAKSAVHRHLQTLVGRGYLWQNPETLRYRTGIQCHLLGRQAAQAVDLLAAAMPAMEDLRTRLGLTVTLAIGKQAKVMIVERLFGPLPLEIGLRPGSEFSMLHSSQGKIFLAFGSAPFWQRARASPEAEPAHLESLQHQCAIARRQGWAAAPEEIVPGINAVSAPVFDAKGVCVAALTVAGPLRLLPALPGAAQLEVLTGAASRISFQLGCRPPGSATSPGQGQSMPPCPSENRATTSR